MTIWQQRQERQAAIDISALQKDFSFQEEMPIPQTLCVIQSEKEVPVTKQSACEGESGFQLLDLGDRSAVLQEKCEIHL